MTDAPWGELRGLAAAPAPVSAEQAKATGKWRDNIRRSGSGTGQSGRTTGEAGVSAAGSQRAQRPNEIESGMQGNTTDEAAARERQTESDSVSIYP